MKNTMITKTVNPIQEHQKAEKVTRVCGYAKKFVFILTTVMCLMAMAATTVFAASGAIDTTDFIDKSVIVLQSLISLIGAGLAIWGVVNLIEGYGNDNAGAKSQGMKQLMAGLALILLALVVVPVLKTMMTSAMT